MNRTLREALIHEVEAYDLNSCIIHIRQETIFHYEKETAISAKLGPINSCTKSILSALVCIAMDQGLVPAPSTLASSFFPQLQQDADERKHRMTLEHLLTLTAGFEWNEFGGLNSFPKMTREANWMQYALQQPLANMPGSTMVYNSGVSQLLAAVLYQCIEQPIAQYAEHHLFEPLAIQQYEWKSDPQHIHTGGFGLNLTANDMLKFGLLYLQKGIWQGQHVISEQKVIQSTSPFIATAPPERGYYGWHWWVDAVSISTEKSKDKEAFSAQELNYYYARGFGGQFIFIIPALDTVVVTTRTPRKKGLQPHDLFRKKIAPLLYQHFHS